MQPFPPKSFFARIVKNDTSPLCRIRNKQEETVDHIISVCSELTKTDYPERANKAAAYYPLEGYRGSMNTSLRLSLKMKNFKFFRICRYISKESCLQTSPDILFKDHDTNRGCKLIDVLVPSDTNTSTKVIEKASKHKDLEIKITKMWGMKTDCAS